MKLLYPEEHLSCVNYLKDRSVGFSIQYLHKNEEFLLLDKKMNYILFYRAER